MRAFLTGEEATVSGTAFRVSIRVKVANGSGTMIDVSTYVKRVLLDEDIDQQAQGVTVELHRDNGTNLTLSPLMEASTLNVLDNNVTYSPLLDVTRRVTIETATTAVATAASGTDWKLVFDGTIDELDWSRPTIGIACRDKASVLVDRQMESKWDIPELAIPMETAIRNILNAHFTGADAITLYVPTSPVFPLNNNGKGSTLPQSSVMDAITSLANLAGWTIGYKWRAATSAYELTLYLPDRAKITADFTFSPSRYIDVKRLTINRADIRNKGTLYWYDGPSAVSKSSSTYSDSTSIARYGLRYIAIDEADESPIDTAVEALGMITAIIKDLKDPKAEQEIEMHYFWPVELGDLYLFQANGAHYSVNQTLAVTGIRHELSQGNHRTLLKVRGNPSAGYFSWLQKGAGEPTQPDAAYSISKFEEISKTSTTRTWRGDVGTKVSEVWGAYGIYEIANFVPVNPALYANPWAEVAGSVAPVTVTSFQFTVAFPQPAQGYVVLGQYEPRDASLKVKSERIQRITIESVADGIPVIIFTEVSGTTVKVIGDRDVGSIKLAHVGGTWVYHADGPSLSVDVTVTGTNAVTGMPNNATWPITVTAYFDSKTNVTGSSASDTKTVTVSRGTGTSEPVWDSVIATAPATAGSDAVTLSLDASAAPASYVAKVYEKHTDNFGAWTAYVDITGSLSPALTAPPTSATSYTYATGYPKSTTGWLISQDFKCDIWNAGSNVVATRTERATWRTPL